MLNTHSDRLLEFALVTGFVAAVLGLLAAALIVHMRLALLRRTRREQAFLAVWRPILVRALLSGVPLSLPPLAPADRVFFLGLWVQLQESVRGTESAGLLQVARGLRCDAIARGLLLKGNHAEKLLAILALGHLRDPSAWTLLDLSARGPDSVKSLNALRAMIQIDAERAANELMPLILTQNDWPLARVASFLATRPLAFAAPLMDAVESSRGVQLIKALSFVEALRLQLPIRTLARLLGSDQPGDTIIAALRVTQSPELLPLVRTHLLNADWRIRVQVAKVLGRIGGPQDVTGLCKLMCDAEWWVRHRAAQATARLPFLERRQLEILRDSLTDRYARDTLSEAMVEGMPS